MFILNILWTIDLMNEDEDSKLSPKMFSCAIANDMVLSGTNISLICSSETSSAVLSAASISKDISTQLSEKTDNPIYVFPYINCPYNDNYRLAHKLPIRNAKFLKQLDDYPLFYKYFSEYKHFNSFIIPVIKQLLWVKYSLHKNYNKTKHYEYNILIISHPYFIENTFNASIEKGEIMKQRFVFDNFDNNKPSNVILNHPTSYHRWHKNIIISKKKENYRKVFLDTN
jgi:hypothetical protein